VAWKLKLTLDHLILGAGIVFLALQIPEEGLFNFAAWAGRHGVAPNFTVTTWLLLQPYFILALSLAYFIYRIDPGKFFPVGLGILVWGLVEFLGFSGLTLATGEYVPGLLSSVIYLPLALAGVRILRGEGKGSPRLALLATVCGVLITALPIAAFFGVSGALGL
jgi:hypothetical protein